MKKSKIIVPALAVLCLSTAAAVSGTVAWFSAGRDTTIEVNSTVINPEGDLKVELAVGKNTAFVKDDEGNAKAKSITMASNTYLRDSSVAIADGAFTAYRAILADETPTGYAVVGEDEINKTIKDAAGSDKIVGYYASFKMTFSIPGAALDSKFDLFFNPAASTPFNPKSGEDANYENVQTAYRVGMYNDDHTVIYAPGQNAGSELTYVNGTTTTSLNKYVNASSGKVTNTMTQDDAEDTNKFLGEIVGKDTLTVNVIMWYEGSDENCVTSVLDFLNTSSYTYTLGFNAINQNDFAA